MGAEQELHGGARRAPGGFRSRVPRAWRSALRLPRSDGRHTLR